MKDNRNLLYLPAKKVKDSTLHRVKSHALLTPLCDTCLSGKPTNATLITYPD